MKYFEIETHQKKLDGLFKQIRNISPDLELQAHWVKYLCVLVSGFLEISIRIIYGRYADTKAEHRVAKFVDGQLKQHFQNLNMDKIIQLASSFSTEWGTELHAACDGELESSVNSIVSNRNRIAHGEDVPGLTYGRISDYYGNVVKVIHLIEGQCT